MRDSARREAELFDAVLVLPEEAREPFLRQACGDDEALRGRIVRLLAASNEAGVFLEAPPLLGPEIRPRGDRDEPLIGQRIGPFMIVRTLGEGGCGIVYEAEQTAPVRRTVAIKVIKPGLDTREVIARFEAERQALALMDHPGIARVFEAGSTAQGRPYFAMELVRGPAITEHCDRQRLGIRDRLELFIRICLAVQYAHDTGVIHRDLKPSNILVAVHDGIAMPKIIDFGVAKATHAYLAETPWKTSVTEWLGTPACMSPEQTRIPAAAIDARTDIYGLGALLYEMLAGVPVFEPRELAAAGFDEIRRRIREDEPVRPSARLAGLPAETRAAITDRRSVGPDGLVAGLRDRLDWIALRCLAKDPERRYQSASALADDVRRYLEGGSVQARGPGVWGACRRIVSAVAGRSRMGGAYRPSVAAAPTPVVDERSIAVLPFSLHGAGPGDTFLAEGLHEDVITHLAKVHDLRVISRGSVQAGRGAGRPMARIAAELGVAHLLLGSVRRSGGRMRLTAQLVDARTDALVWAETYDRELGDVLELQGAVACEIAQALKARLTPRERALIGRVPTTDPTAYAAFLRGRGLAARSYTRADLEGAVAAFEQAVALDARFALAWAHLSMAHGAMYWFTFMDPTSGRLARSKAAVDEALRLQPDLPEAHLTMGVFFYRGYRDWLQALGELDVARESMPGDAELHCARGLALRRMGRWDESTRAFEEAVVFDPLNGNAWLGLSDNHGFHRRFRRSLEASEHLLGFAPEHRLARRCACWSRFALDGDEATLFTALERAADAGPDGVRDRVELALWRGDCDGALHELGQAEAPSFRDQKREIARADLQALAAHLKGDAPAARLFATQAGAFYAQSALHREPERVFTTISLARTLALQGRADDARAMGRRAMELLPVSRDAVWGPEIIGEYAALCLLVGDTAEALHHLERMVRHPWDVSTNELHLDPLWRRLRGDPRFEAITALAAPT